MKMIETAVVPAAGYGARMKPLTLAFPKEMFPLGRMPIIELTIRELVSSGNSVEAGFLFCVLNYIIMAND